MTGRIAAIAIVLSAAITAVAVWYLQVFGFYDRVEDAEISVMTEAGPRTLKTEEFQGIDADSSPLRFRGCFALAEDQAPILANATPAADPVPLVAPGWFDCFDAEAIGTALERGEGAALLGTRNIRDGVDRIVALFPDGRGYVWHQLNETYQD